MTPEQQRIAIAEACGWEIRSVIGWVGDKPSDPRCFIPDYPSDLNAMHEAEKSLGGPTDFRWSGYMTHLQDACGEGSRVSSTAPQRAEAFLRTIGKWTE